MSGPISNDWFNFYQQGFPAPSSVSEATAVTTTAVPAQLSPEGRVSKPMRRRSRASRRTPTTLLNTDTTNFRAMVQQFTGAPSAPGLFGPRAVPVNPNGLMLAPSQHLYQPQHYTCTEGGEKGFVERGTVTAPNDVTFMEHGGSFFPTTTP
ncbi:VQ motif-containing protein 22 [Cajanus cajan]|uniref:VQ domain-containing protein n=1 Tax=Cajanus cajan TaxID=3821 RepID=A0A151RZV8_CAJCA|nr:VQ motif-containing protein 22 [Cajanus cajan]KYP48103.1 hypothetical protein KK1_030186 [Cajanus cajan]